MRMNSAKPRLALARPAHHPLSDTVRKAGWEPVPYPFTRLQPSILPPPIPLATAGAVLLLSPSGARVAGPAVEAVHAALVDAEGRDIEMEGLDRFAFYDAAARAVLVVHTSDARPYACFLVTKGVI